MNILVVEDHATNRKLLRAQLESVGHDVVEVGDGVEALEFLRRESVDLVISDILMPNMDGFRLCHEIRRDPGLSTMPFVLYTSTYNSPADRTLAVTVGADRFVTKPAPPSVLAEAISHAMARKVAGVPVARPAHDENHVLKRYSEALVRKLEEKNLELEEALAEVRSSREAILALNRELEDRVEKRTAQLAEANRDLEAFSYTASHDLRAPLRRIDGFVRLLESQLGPLLDADGRKSLEVILKSVAEMQRLIHDLLAFARAGRAEMDRRAVPLDDLVDDVLGAMRPDLESRRIDWEREPLPTVWGDPDLLRIAFVNLLGNAAKYSRPRDPARIRISHEATSGDVVVLCVRDNGVGFDPARADRLFGVFQRLHRADEFEGTGIGLAIVHRVLWRHGGRIWAESRPDEGASFFFTLHSTGSNRTSTDALPS